MWFIIGVKEYHQGGSLANAAKFRELAVNSTHPLGLIAYADGRPVGWAAVGPRSRYARAVRTPTMKSIDHSENEDVWLVPCFFINPTCAGRKSPNRCLNARWTWPKSPRQRFFGFSQFKRSAMPNGPKVSAGGSLSPRGDWRAPSDGNARIWLKELDENVPDEPA